MSAELPDWAKGDNAKSVDYHDMVASWGYTVEHLEYFGDYQGDVVALLTRPNAVGLVVIGYGSCSGCDVLEAVKDEVYYVSDGTDLQPLIDLSESLREDIHWEKSRRVLREWIDANLANHWWRWDREIMEWINTILPQ